MKKQDYIQIGNLFAKAAFKAANSHDRIVIGDTFSEFKDFYCLNSEQEFLRINLMQKGYDDETERLFQDTKSPIQIAQERELKTFISRNK